jgi:hypothetical protein
VKARRNVGMVAPVVTWCLILVMGGAAYGYDALQGSDISYTVNSNQALRVCDREADGRGVHADGVTWANNSFEVHDMDGAGGKCWTSYDKPSGVKKHRTVEEIKRWPDAEGDWSYHY